MDIVVIDTCVLFSQIIRDVLLRAAESDLYQIRWSEDILDELSRNLQQDRGLSVEKALHLLIEMRNAFPEAMVTGYEHLIDRMENDPSDRHVLAAAVHSTANVIVTDNLRDFPAKVLVQYHVETQTPDEFLAYLYDRNPDQITRIIIDLNAARKRPPESLRSTLDRLAKGSPDFVARVRQHPLLTSLLQMEMEK